MASEYQLPFTGAEVETLMNIVNALADWAKASEKPTYTADEVGARPSTWTPSASDVGADPAGTAAGTVSSHNTAEDAHEDIRLLVAGLTSRLNALADSDDETLDQLSELVAYIKANRELIEQVTTGKVSVSDIIDNLATNVANKPLAASQGVALKALIDAITVPTKVSELQNDAGYLTQHQDISGKANTSDLTSHTGNTAVHITAAERTKWNQAVTDVGTLSEEIANYLPKNQGSANVGKILVVGTDGNITLAEMPEGSSGDVTGVIDEANNMLLSGNIPSGTYTVRFVNEDGTYSDPVTMVVGAIPEPDEPTGSGNLADPSSADWQEGYRLSISSGGTSALAGHTTTNFIPCKVGDVLRVKGLTIVGFLNGATSDIANMAKIVCYDSSKTKINGLYGATSATSSTDGYGSKVTVNGDISTLTVLFANDGSQKATSDCAYIRIDGALMDGYTAEDVIITINEEITESDTPNVGGNTNLIPLSVDASGNPYVGTNGEDGYKAGYKISVSRGNESSATGYKVTGFIPVKYNDTMYFKGISFETSGTNTNYCFYDSNKTRIAGGNWYQIFAEGVNGEMVSTVINSNTPLNLVVGDISNVAYIRFSASVLDENSIMTVNEQIV